MRIKLLAAGLMLSFCFSNLAMAGSLQADRETVLSKAPIYVMVELGRYELCSEAPLTPNVMDTYCSLDDQLATLQSHSGSIEAVQGKITLAVDLFINTDETLTNAINDLGSPTNKIDFAFKTNFSKGLIIKVQPDEDYQEDGTIDKAGRLVFYVNTGAIPKKVLEIPYSDLVGETFGNWESDGYGYGYLIRRIDFEEGADLTARNLSFKNRLAVAEKLMPVAVWARESLIKEKITPALYRNFDALVQSLWFKDYDDAEVEYFIWRYNRLEHYFKKYSPTPERFYGGLQVLMNRFN